MNSSGGKYWNSFAPVACSRKKKKPATAQRMASTPIGEEIRAAVSGMRGGSGGNKASEYRTYLKIVHGRDAGPRVVESGEAQLGGVILACILVRQGCRLDGHPRSD